MSLVGCGNPNSYNHEHNFCAETVASTYTHQGYTRYTCKTCGFEMLGDFVSILQNGGILTIIVFAWNAYTGDYKFIIPIEI